MPITRHGSIFLVVLGGSQLTASGLLSLPKGPRGSGVRCFLHTGMSSAQTVCDRKNGGLGGCDRKETPSAGVGLRSSKMQHISLWLRGSRSRCVGEVLSCLVLSCQGHGQIRTPGPTSAGVSLTFAVPSSKLARARPPLARRSRLPRSAAASTLPTSRQANVRRMICATPAPVDQTTNTGKS